MSQAANSVDIESIMKEHRVFPPPESFSERAHIRNREQYDRLYRQSLDDPETFWGNVASELHWFKKWDKVLEWKTPYAKWFVGRQDQPGLQLPGPADRDRARRQDRHPRGKASRRPSAARAGRCGG